MRLLRNVISANDNEVLGVRSSGSLVKRSAGSLVTPVEYTSAGEVVAAGNRVLTRFVLKYTLRAAHLELGGVEREVRRGGNP